MKDGGTRIDIIGMIPARTSRPLVVADPNFVED